MKRTLPFIASLFVLVIAASPVFAQGFYAGAGIGSSFFSTEFKIDDVTDEVQKIDENSTAWKIFGGFSQGKFIGIEGGYRDFGNIETGEGDDLAKSKTSGWDIEALGKVQIAIVDIFAKAGVMFWSTDVTFFGIDGNESGTDFLWGLGAGLHFGPIGARLEWETLEGGGPDNLSMVSLSGTFGF